jgi:hypothetical protein
MFDGNADGPPSALHIGLICRSVAIGHHDAIVSPPRADPVADPVNRSPYAPGEFAGPFEDGIDDVIAGIGKPIVLSKVADVGDRIKDEPDLSGRR